MYLCFNVILVSKASLLAKRVTTGLGSLGMILLCSVSVVGACKGLGSDKPPDFLKNK